MKVEPTIVTSQYDESGEELSDVYFDITLVIDKDNNLRVYNTEEDGDWREDVDCNTLLVKELRLRP